MEQAIVLFPKRDKKIEETRKKYDPSYRKFISHITLIFPFKDIPQTKLNNHIKKALLKIKPFKIRLKELKKSKKEFYLYLLVKEGKKEINQIRKRLYSSLLTRYIRKDIPYIPHMTIGIFKTKKEINQAIELIKSKNLNLTYKVKSIQLLTLKKDHSLKSVKSFLLRYQSSH